VDHYTIADFLKERANQSRNGKITTSRKDARAFLSGSTFVGVGEVLQELDRVAREFRHTQEPPHTLTPPYESLKSGSAALTSYAAQKVRDRLLKEQKAATEALKDAMDMFCPHFRGE
jgi:hypothetical protein